MQFLKCYITSLMFKTYNINVLLLQGFFLIQHECREVVSARYSTSLYALRV